MIIAKTINFIFKTNINKEGEVQCILSRTRNYKIFYKFYLFEFHNCKVKEVLKV